MSRELNLLRLRLAEKQRDIVAQKQRTKEQLEEERKKVGQNVFWLAVGKNRERTKDGNEVSLGSLYLGDWVIGRRQKKHFLIIELFNVSKVCLSISFDAAPCPL